MPAMICWRAPATSSETGAAAGAAGGTADEAELGAGAAPEEDAPGVDDGSVAVASAVGDEVGGFAQAFAFGLGLALAFTSVGSGCAMPVTT